MKNGVESVEQQVRRQDIQQPERGRHQAQRGDAVAKGRERERDQVRMMGGPLDVRDIHRAVGGIREDAARDDALARLVVVQARRDAVVVPDADCQGEDQDNYDEYQRRYSPGPTLHTCADRRWHRCAAPGPSP